MGSVEDIFDSMTDEQKRRATNLRTPEEMLAFAKEQGYDLTDDQLEAVAGGGWVNPPCPGYAERADDQCGNVAS